MSETLPGFDDVPEKSQQDARGFLDWEGASIPVSKNPMVMIYGRGPEGRKCKECKHFLRFQRDKVYRKCEIRGVTHGLGTDHLASYEACKKFEEEYKNV